VPTTDCIPPIQVQLKGRALTIACDAPNVSSDGGALLLRKQDERLGLSERFAALLCDDRDSERRNHERLTQLRQRVYQICLGYEDCNDADVLRHDAVLQLACGTEARELSSQPTLSRFENGISWAELKRLWREFERQYVDSLDPAALSVVLDIDGTDDPTHGDQQLSMFHGFYDQHMFHPLLILDGDTGQLVTAVLRAGNAHAARGAVGLLRRLIRAIRRRCPRATILVRGDSAFGIPRVLEALEQLSRELGDVHYVFGLVKNPRLLAVATPLISEAAEAFQRTNEFVRIFASHRYQAGPWTRARRVIVKVEYGERGENPRFLVTTLQTAVAQIVYDCAFCPRGQAENRIKDLKNALRADRLSCHRFVANSFRLLLHAVAYRLMFALRSTVAEEAPALASVQMDTLRLRLLKVAAEAVSSVRRVVVRLPAAFPAASVFVAIAARLCPS
jgi:hypothetical protein